MQFLVIINTLKIKLYNINFDLNNCFSGVLVEYDLTKSPGNRVSSLLLRCGECNVPKYEPLQLTANYTIVTNSYLAEGGDNFKSFKKGLKKNKALGL